MSSRRRSQRGFTLLEVLVALAVLALVLGVALEQERLSVGAARRAEAQSLALALAQNKLSELALTARWAEWQDGGDEAGLRWERRIRPAVEHGDRAVGGGPLRLWHVEVEVTGRDASVHLATLRLVEQRQ